MRSRERRSSSRSRRGCIRCGCSASLRSRARWDSRRRTALGMPELPDVVVYVESLARRIAGRRLDRVRLISPFVLRSVVPPLAAAEGRRVDAVRRLGKRIVISLEDEIFLVLHLMIAGRLRWLERGEKLPARITLAAFDFATGTVAFTEAGTRKRASLHVVQGEAALAAFDLGGLDIAGSTLAAFRERLLRENHTLKRALSDRRRDPRRSRPVAPLEIELAAIDRRARLTARCSVLSRIVREAACVGTIFAAVRTSRTPAAAADSAEDSRSAGAR